MREAHSTQAIARLRLVEPSGPKRVLLLCSIPLPDLPVSRFITWEGLAATRLRQAIAAAPKSEGVSGLRLSADGLHGDAPSVFKSAAAAKSWRRHRPTADLVADANRINRTSGRPTVLVELCVRDKGGKPVPALVFAHLDEAERAARRLWPSYDFARVKSVLAYASEPRPEVDSAAN